MNAKHEANECAKLINDVADGLLWVKDGEIQYIPEDGCRQADMNDYFDISYDITYTVNEFKEYMSVKVVVAVGGPDIFIDTEKKEVVCVWGWDRSSVPISNRAAEQIDEIFEHKYTEA